MTVDIAKPLLDEQEILEVTRVINSGMLASGPETSKFEIEFADFVGSKYACAVNNGTSAICLALSAMGISPGDEVITTPMTFVATANSILSCGAIPVFADVEESTFNLSPSAVEDAITEKTKAILPVSIWFTSRYGISQIYCRSERYSPNRRRSPSTWCKTWRKNGWHSW